MQLAIRVVRNSVLLAVAVFVFSILVNTFRPSGSLPLFAKAPYQIFTDCPEAVRTAAPISASEAAKHPNALFVCACTTEEFEAGHIAGALFVEYDPLFPIDEHVVAEIKQRAESIPEPLSRKLKRIGEFLMTGHMPPRQTEVAVIVYGADQVSVKGLADELASAGVPGVRFCLADAQQLARYGLRVQK